MTRLGHRLHGLLARKPSAYRLYLLIWSYFFRVLRWQRLRQWMQIQLLANAPFGLALPERWVELGNPAVRVKWMPHTGMLDQVLIFENTLNYESEVMMLLDRLLPEKHLVIEIGANIGLNTIYMAKRLAALSSDRLVVSFEPSQITLRALLDNLLLNDIRNVAVCNSAIHANCGIARFNESLIGRYNTCNSLIDGFVNMGSGEYRQIPVSLLSATSLEPLFEHAAGRGILVKIDAEGVDIEIVRTLEPLLRRYRSDLIVEVLHYQEAQWNQLSYLGEIYDFLHLTAAGPIARQRFEADASYGFRDYWLRPKPIH